MSVSAGSIVVPNAYTNTEAPNDINGPFSGSAITFQFQLSASQFGSVPIGSSITGIGFRLDSSYATSEPTLSQTYANYQIVLSSATNALNSLSDTFANNEGADATLVYNAPLVLGPNALVGGSSPNPFLLLTFSTPYVYEGGDLVTTILYNNPTGSSPMSIDVDGLSSGDGIGNVVLFDGYNSPTGSGGYNYPVTEFVFGASSVPEPSTFALAGAGAIACWLLRRRRA
jgi:hypothetical protein